VVSFYISRNTKVQSTIKIGGYDSLAVVEGQPIKKVKSMHANFPGIQLYDIVASSNVVRPSDQARYLVFEPQFPYMYVPLEDFKHWMITISRTFPDIICNYSPKGTCYFSTACENVAMQDHLIKFYVGDSEQQTEFLEFKMGDTLVSGSLVGDTHNTCYMGVFKSEEQEQNIWYMGTMFMSSYYVTLNYTDSIENGDDYVVVGFGKKNPISLVFQ
jgi:hypothetical protein